MPDIALPLQEFLKGMDEDAAKAYRIRKIYDAFGQAILAVYGATAARLVLSHVQAVYIMEDDGTYVGDAQPLRLLRVYTDDPTVRADLDARQEFIKMRLAALGYSVDRLRLHASTFGMKEREPYKDFLDRLEKGQVATPDTQGHAFEEAAQAAMVKNLQVLKAALCQVFGEHADEVVKAINAAYVKTRGKARPLACVYVQDDDARMALEAQREAVAARARELGLPLLRLDVKAAEPWMVSRQAFPALSAPVIIER